MRCSVMAVLTMGVLGALGACGGESENGSGGSGGSATGGAGTGGATGGSGGATGGSGGATGGTGGATGGTGGATGGTGGATGGTAGGGTGGTSTGGAAGAGATGGSGGTGATGTCASASDCVMSSYSQPVSSEADCYCPLCPDTPMTATEAAARAAAWAQHCTLWAQNNPCPVPSCVQQPPPVCVGGTCMMPSPEAACLQSGGTVGTALCCQSTGDFPPSCTTGACGCSPQNSHEVKVCVCPNAGCFTGTTCM